jgi:NitT/TauT family transport system substrate-binding protein
VFLCCADSDLVTPATHKDGIGAYDRDRQAQNIAQVGKAFGLARIPDVSEIYDDRFLPPRDERMPLQ